MSAELSPELLEMDALLRRASREFAYPPTPRIAEAVAARLRAEPARRPLVERVFAAPLARAAAAALLALVAVAGVSLAVPQSRDALADFFGLRHVRIDREPVTGPLPPPLSPESFAQPATIEGAQAILDFTLRFPTRDGVALQPDAAYAWDLNSTAPGVIFVYEDEGYDLYQSRHGLFGKGGNDPNVFHEIEIDGEPAYWVEEGGHIARLYDAEGRLIIRSERTVDRATLLWQRDGITFRLETSLSEAEAVAVARSLR